MGDSEKLKEKKMQSQEIYKGRLLHVFCDKVRLPNNHTSTREWIRHPGAAAVIPVFDDGRIMMVRQFRYPVGKILYEVPAGKIDEGESPKETAVRELKEEVGLICKNLHPLGGFHPSIGYSNEIIHLYCGWNITETEPQVEDDEFLEPIKISFEKAVQMVHQGHITDGKTMVALLQAWYWWQHEKTI